MALGPGEPRFDRVLTKLRLQHPAACHSGATRSVEPGIHNHDREYGFRSAPVAHPGMTAVLVGRPETTALFRRLRVIRNRRARADQIAVAIDIVDASDRRPVFVGARGAGGEASLGAAIGALPPV